jgi:hypothetical protein
MNNKTKLESLSKKLSNEQVTQTNSGEETSMRNPNITQLKEDHGK